MKLIPQDITAEKQTPFLSSVCLLLFYLKPHDIAQENFK